MRRGFTLIELIAAMGVAGSLTAIQLAEEDVQQSQRTAKALGSEMYQYNSAVGRIISKNAADPSALGVSAGSSVTFIGSDWLKSSTCSGGTASADFLSCNAIPNGRTINYQSQPTTVISENSDGSLSARTVWSPAIGVNGSPDPMAMGLAALVASGSYATQVGDDSGGYQNPTVYCPDISVYSSEISAICGSDRNRVISEATINSRLEPWLRTDHGNTMSHVIDFGSSPASASSIASVDDGGSMGTWSGSGMRQIINVARLYNGGTGSESIVLGQRGGKSIFSSSFLTARGLLSDAIIMDGDAAVMNDFYVNGQAFFTKSIDVDDDVLVGRDVDAGRDMHASRDIGAGRNVTASNDIRSTGGDIISSVGMVQGAYVASTGDLRASNNVHAQRYYDANNSTYYTDPSSRSNVSSITAHGDIRAPRFYDQNNTGYYIDPSSRSNLNSVTASGDMRARVFYDQDNTGYRGDFSGTTRSNHIDTNTLTSRGRLRTNEYLHLNRSVSIGGGCSPNGLVGRASDGKLASCVSGRWATSSSKPKVTIYSRGYSGGSNSVYLGFHDFCTSQYGNENNNDDTWRGVIRNGDGSWTMRWNDGGQTAACLDF